MKVQVKTVFKSYFLSPKNQKADRLCMKDSSTSNTIVDFEVVHLSKLFLKPLYPTIFAEKFEIYGVKMTGIYICESKDCIYLTQTAFLKIYFYPAEREDYGTEKITKTKFARALVTSFDRFHHLCNLYIFGFCFVVS